MGIYLGSETQSFWQSTRKTLNDDGKQKYKKNLLEGISSILMPFGNRQWGHPVKLDVIPIRTVVKKIARGLHWHTTGEVLPPDVEVDMYFLKQGENLNPEVKTILNDHGRWVVSGNGIFQAQYGIPYDEKLTSMWLLRFYDQDCFSVIIMPRNIKENAA